MLLTVESESFVTDVPRSSRFVRTCVTASYEAALGAERNATKRHHEHERGHDGQAAADDAEDALQAGGVGDVVSVLSAHAEHLLRRSVHGHGASGSAELSTVNSA